MTQESIQNSTASIEKVAIGQKFVIYAILVNLASIGVALFPPPFAILAVLGNLAALILSVIGVFRLVSGMGYSLGAKILFIVLMFVPLLNLISLLVLNSRATKALRGAGFKVGLLGAQSPASA